MTTTSEAQELLEAIDRTVTQIVVNARRQYTIGMEVAIKRYQRAMWQTIKDYEQKLSLSVGDSGHHKIVVVNLIADLTRLGEHNLRLAANSGFERALADLFARGWVRRYSQPVIAPRSVFEDSVAQNRKYLEQSLLPDLHRDLDKVKSADDVPRVLVAYRGRIFMYGHWMWRTAERAYTDGMQQFFAFSKRVPMREGGAGSGNFAHAGRPGEVGGSANATFPGIGAHGGVADMPKETSLARSLLVEFVQESLSDGAAELRAAKNIAEGKSPTADFPPTQLSDFGIETPEQDVDPNYIAQHGTVDSLKALEAYSQKEWDKLYPNGYTLERGVHKSAPRFAQMNLGDTLHLGPVISTTDNHTTAVDLSGGRTGAILEFKNVTGKDVLASIRISTEHALYNAHPEESETTLCGQSDWKLTAKSSEPTRQEFDNGFVPRYTFERINLKEAQAKPRTLVFSDADVAWWKNELQEGGVGSGNFAHAGRPGQVGGSTSGTANKPAGQVQTAANEIGVDPNGPAPWDMQAPAPPRYPGDTSIYSPALPDAHGNYTLGRRLQGSKLNPAGDPNQVAMYMFIPARANTDQLLKYEGVINAYSDHAQLHPGTIAYKDANGLQKTDGNNYWIRGDYRDLLALNDTLTPQLVKDFDRDTYTTMMTDTTPGGTKIGAGDPLDHIRVVVPFNSDTPKNTVGEPSIGREGRDQILMALSGEGRHVWEHADFNGIHLATSAPAGTADKIIPIVTKLGGAEEKEHSVGATRFIPSTVNIERYRVRGLREAEDDNPTALFVGPDDSETCDGCDEAVNGNPYTIDDVPQPGEFECMSRCRHMVQLQGDAPADLAPFEWHGSIGFGELAVEPQEPTDLAQAVDERTATMLNSLGISSEDVTSFADFIAGGGFDDLATFLVQNDMGLDDVAGPLELDDEAAAALSAAMDKVLTTGIGEDELMYALQNGDIEFIQQALDADPVNTMDILNDISANGFDDANAIIAETFAQALGKTAYIAEDGRWYVR